MAEETATTEETPAVETPAVETPAVETPAVETPAVEESSALLAEKEVPDPVNYGEVELPEGVEMSADLLEKYTEQLNGANVSADQAKELFPIVAEITKGMQDEQLKAFETYREDQRTAISAMSDEDKASAKKAALKFGEGDEEAMKALGSYKADEAWLVRLLSKVGKAMNEDAFLEGGSGGGHESKPERVLFPSMQK